MAAPKMNMLGEKIVVSNRSGGSLVTFEPKFSHDSKCLFCGCGNVVKVYSTASGECIRKLIAHTDLVTSVALNPRNKLQLFTSSLDQTIKIWDYTDGIILKEYHLRYPVQAILSVFEEEIFVLCKAGPQRYDVVSFSPKDNRTRGLLNHVSSDSRHIAVDSRNRSIAALITRNSQLLYMSGDHRETQSHSVEQPMTCITFHPVENCLVTGAVDGKIYYWWNLGTSKKLIKSIYHWHSLSVLHLKFTAEGSYLLSGGHECVLVKWQYNSSYRDFLPRLGAPLSYIACSPDNQMYAICHHDNVINLVSNKFKLLQVYQGLTVGHLDHQRTRPAPCGLMYDPRSKALVTNGKPGHLQFYSVDMDKQLYNLDIVCENYISPENLRRPTVITEVENAAFSSDGQWLATVQLWDNGIMSPEMLLKFWLYDQESQSYQLNTLVDSPHGAPVKSIKFRPPNPEAPSQPMVVTSSQEGKFKCWVLTDDTNIYRENIRWMCESVGYYRDRPAGATSFAEDGSLMAVGFGAAITLWNPDSNVLRQTLIAGSNVQDIISCMEFGHGNCCHNLVSSSQKYLTVWDLRSCSVSWCVDLMVSELVSDPLTENIAVIAQDQTLYVFKPSEPEPLYTHKSLCNEAVVSSVFIPHTRKSDLQGTELQWQSNSQLYFLTEKQRLMSLMFEEEITEDKSYSEMKLSSTLRQTPLSLLMSQDKKSGAVPTGKSSVDALPSAKYTKEIMMAAPHTQPHVTLLCKKFIQSLLIKNKNERKKDDEDSGDEEEQLESLSSYSSSDMEIDDDTPKNVSKTAVKPVSHNAPSKMANYSDNFMCMVDETDLHEKYLKKALSIDSYDWLSFDT